MAKVHHSAIVTRDVEASLVFWRDGLGLDVLMDETFEGPWPELFGTASTKLRSIFLGDASAGDSGIVELVARPRVRPQPTRRRHVPAEGFFLLSLFADLDEVLPRLAALGVGESQGGRHGPARAWPWCTTPTACGSSSWTPRRSPRSTAWREARRVSTTDARRRGRRHAALAGGDHRVRGRAGWASPISLCAVGAARLRPVRGDGRRGRHLAGEHLPRRRVRRAVAPLLVLLRPQAGLDQDVRQAARDPASTSRSVPSAGTSEPHLRTGIRITSAHWDAGARRWRLSDDEGRHYEADVVVSAIGTFTTPSYPDIAGLA